MKRIKSNFQYIAVIALLLAMFAGGLKHEVVFGELSANAVGGGLVLNVTEAAAVDVVIGGEPQGGLNDYAVASGGQMRVEYDLDTGPVKITSTND